MRGGSSGFATSLEATLVLASSGIWILSVVPVGVVVVVVAGVVVVVVAVVVSAVHKSVLVSLTEEPPTGTKGQRS